MRSRHGLDPRVVVVLLAALLGGAELALRGLGHGGRVLFASSEQYGLLLLPDQECTVPYSEVPMRINSSGFRGPEWDPPAVDGEGRPARDPSLLRVALVGHSVTTGGWERLEETFGGLVESALQEELERRGDPRRALVMNFAVPGHNLDYMERVHDGIVRPYRPDVLVVAIGGPDVRPLPPPREARSGPLRDLWVRTAIHDWLTRTFAGAAPKVLRDVGSDEDAEEHRRVQELADAVQRAPLDPAHDALWEAAFARLDRLRARQAEHGGLLVVACLVELRDVVPPPGWRRCAPRFAAWAAERPDVVLADAAPAFEAAALPLHRELLEKELRPSQVWGMAHPLAAAEGLEHADRSPFLLFSRGHYSRLGHRLQAEAILSALREADVLVRAPSRRP